MPRGLQEPPQLQIKRLISSITDTSVSKMDLQKSTIVKQSSFFSDHQRDAELKFSPDAQGITQAMQHLKLNLRSAIIMLHFLI